MGQEGFVPLETQHRLLESAKPPKSGSRAGELQHGYITRSSTKQALWPPKPKLFFRIRRIDIERASWGT